MTVVVAFLFKKNCRRFADFSLRLRVFAGNKLMLYFYSITKPKLHDLYSNYNSCNC